MYTIVTKVFLNSRLEIASFLHEALVVPMADSLSNITRLAGRQTRFPHESIPVNNPFIQFRVSAVQTYRKANKNLCLKRNVCCHMMWSATFDS